MEISKLNVSRDSVRAVAKGAIAPVDFKNFEKNIKIQQIFIEVFIDISYF